MPAPPEAMTGIFTASATARVIAGLCAIGIHTGKENLPCASLFTLYGPFDSVDIGRLSACLNSDLPVSCFGF